MTTFARCLWYLAEHLLGLAFFNKEVGMVTKHKMVANLEQMSGCPSHLQGVPEIGAGLEEFLTKRMLKIFNIIAE